MDERSARAAENETIFRAGNELIERAVARSNPEEVAFLCECGDESCLERLELTRAEYESVRAVPTRFVVLPGHEDGGVERVASTNERFLVVEKTGEASGLAKATDPRS